MDHQKPWKTRVREACGPVDDVSIAQREIIIHLAAAAVAYGTPADEDMGSMFTAD